MPKPQTKPDKSAKKDLKLPEGKIPPQNLDAEVSILGAVLIDEDVLTRVSDKLAADDFYDPRHEMIFAAMVSLYERHKPVDLLTLSDELKKRGQLEESIEPSYLAQLTNQVPTAANAESYAEIIAQNAMRRRLIKASGNIAELGFDEGKNSDELLADAEAELFAVSDQALRQELTSLEQVLTETFDRMEELHRDKSKMRGIPTGYRDIDNMMAGLQRSDLIILAARPAMGKSTFALNLAHNVAVQQNHAVLVFSLEMSKEQLVDRMLADEAGVDAWNIRTGNLSDDDFEKLSHAMGTLAEAPIFIDDTPGLSVLELRTKARRAAHDRPLGLIVIDYLQLMSGGNTDNRVQEISEISRSLKGLARELDVPVLALSQLSRAVESRPGNVPKLSDLRESGSIEQDADAVLFIYREDRAKENAEKKNVAEIIIAKHRNGPIGKIELYFDEQRVTFKSIDKQHVSPPPSSDDW